MATGSKVRILGTNDWITTVTYYDEKARPIYVYSKNDYLETVDQVKSKYSFDGIVLETTTSHDKSVGGLSLKTIDIEDSYAYDHVNRLTMHTQKINDAALGEVIASNNYDDLGQLVDKGVGGKENASRLQDIGYDYNVRGWLKSINNANGLGNDLFGFKIRYTDPIHSQGVGLYNGNIAEIDWKTQSDNTLFRYTYHYDALNRIKKADFSGGGYWARYRLDNVTYDKNGNILSLRRNGHIVAQPDRNTGSDFGTMDNLTYTYETSSNRLKKVDDATSVSYGFNDGKNLPTEYTYDNNGNMVSDANKDITSITYNHLNLPTNVNFVSGDIAYIYDATGVKQKKIVSGTTTEYAGNFIYENSSLKMFSHPEGYVEQLSAGKVPTFGYAYQYKDHLGNIRLSYMDNNGTLEIIEEHNYYPFGLKHKGYNGTVSANVNSQASKYGFGGKELSNELGLDWHDFDARNYDAALGRWMNLDPLAEDYYEWSPYNYSYNSPIIFTDPTGLGPIYDADGNLIGYEVEEGQGPSQIAEDLNTIGLQAEVSYLDIVYSNPEKFEHIDDVTDINHEGFTELDINKDDVISLDTIIERENAITENKNEIKDVEAEINVDAKAIVDLKEENDSLQEVKKVAIERHALNKKAKAFEGHPSDGRSTGAFSELGSAVRTGAVEIQVNSTVKKNNKSIDSLKDEIKNKQKKINQLKKKS
ncbi:MAG: RHS repeat domain-containing protein [Winogradskyella sp.]